eukprot:4936322-Pyramimonas_sp.AAC.1
MSSGPRPPEAPPSPRKPPEASGGPQGANTTSKNLDLQTSRIEDPPGSELAVKDIIASGPSKSCSRCRAGLIPLCGPGLVPAF